MVYWWILIVPEKRSPVSVRFRVPALECKPAKSVVRENVRKSLFLHVVWHTIHPLLYFVCVTIVRQKLKSLLSVAIKGLRFSLRVCFRMKSVLWLMEGLKRGHLPHAGVMLKP